MNGLLRVRQDKRDKYIVAMYYCCCIQIKKRQDVCLVLIPRYLLCFILLIILFIVCVNHPLDNLFIFKSTHRRRSVNEHFEKIKAKIIERRNTGFFCLIESFILYMHTPLTMEINRTEVYVVKKIWLLLLLFHQIALLLEVL